MPWLISFIISWIVFFILIDFRNIKKTVFAGICAVLFQFSIDYYAMKYGLYKITDPIAAVWDSSIFFVFGPVFTMGILFVQYLPRMDKWLRLINIFIWSSFFMLFEIFIISAGVLVYIKWSHFNSFTIDIAAIMMLSWIGENFLMPIKKNSEYRSHSDS